MNIPKAIKLLNELDKGCGPLDIPQYECAIKLGEEALKRVRDCRGVLCDIGRKPLPGETKE